jgi:2-hydroxychromene-2-carboxylate isomerase
MGVPLTYCPLLLGGVFAANNVPQKLFSTLSPAKAAHGTADMQRWARKLGVTLTMPEGHPRRSVEALRATLATGIDPNVIDAFYRAYWVDNLDIGDRKVIADILTSCGQSAESVLDAIDQPAIKDDLRKRTEEAIRIGIFGIPAWVVDGEHLYWGQDRMAFVEGLRQPPLDVAPPKRSSHLDFYWDFSSPFAYLGAIQVEALAKRTGASVSYRPLLLGGLFRALGGPDVPLATFSEAKQRYIAKDLERWAAYLNVPYRFPSRFPTHSLRALRVYLALPEARRASYRDAVFRACWADDRDITDDAVLASCIGDVDVARAAFVDADSPVVKAALRDATEAALHKGVFGVPTYIVNDRELYWGQDRTELVEDALRAG